jgi:hypothetical protein
LTEDEYYDIVVFMTDAELTRSLERCQPPAAGFHHADHLRVAWVYLQEAATVDEALARMAATLRRFAAAVGQSAKYSDAITAFWIYQMAAARAMMPGAACADVFRAYPRLLDKDFIDAAPPGATDPPRDAPDWALPRRPA